MNIAILEDRLEEAQLLSSHLTRYAQTHSISIEIFSYETPEALLSAFDQRAFSLAFLDIYLGDHPVTGMDIGKTLKEAYPACKLIFATTSHAHAVAGYATKAAAYLIKPVAYEALSQAMELCGIEFFRQNQGLHFFSGGNEKKVLLSDIMYIDCIERQTILHLATESLSMDALIGEVKEDLLIHDRFLLCNRDLLVNMDWIAKTEIDFFLLKNNQRVPIRSRGRKEIKQAYVAYRMKRFAKGGML